MGEPIKECWDRRQYHTGLAHIKRNRRTQFGISGAAIKPKWDGPTYPKGMTQLTNVAGPTLVKPAGPLQVSGLKILTSVLCTKFDHYHFYSSFAIDTLLREIIYINFHYYHGHIRHT